MHLNINKGKIFYELRNWDIPSNDIPILLLHSALSTHKEFDKLSAFYGNRKQILLDFPAHGESTTNRKELTIKNLAEDVRDLLFDLKIFSVDIIGYSMGGYVALELARIAPSLPHSIVSHAMKFYWTEEAITKSLTSLDVDTIKARSMKGYEILSAMHSTNGLVKTIETNKDIVGSFRSEKLSEEDLLNINVPLLLSVGDRDDLIPLIEISRLYESQDKKKTFLAIHPDSPHPLSKIDITSFTHAIREFWNIL